MNIRQFVALVTAPSLMFVLPVNAVEVSLGEWSGSWDTTLSYGVSSRVQGRDSRIIGVANGGDAYGVNADDGNLNYDKGIVSNALKVTSEMELSRGMLGAFVRASALYDIENKDGTRSKTPLSKEAQDLVGSRVDLLDAYVWGQFDVGDSPAEIRLGNQLLSWGESTYIQNSINTINPVDVSKIRVPGAELREALLPVPMLSGSISPSENTSLEAFYQLRWEKTEADPTGSYFSGNDFAGAGSDRVMLGWGRVPDTAEPGVIFPGEASDSVVSRGRDREAKDDGQYGLAFRLYVPALNDTEFGFYYINYHSRLPLIGARTGTEAAAMKADPNGLSYIQTSEYFISYPEDIKLYGISFNTSLGSSGIALQGEFSYRQDVPLQIDDVEILFGALGAQYAANPSSLTAAALANYGQLGLVPFETDIPGYIRRDMTQAQVTATKLFGPNFGADAIVLLAEAGVNSVVGMPDKDVLRLNGPGTFLSGNEALSSAHYSTFESESRFADETSWGYRVMTRMLFENALAGASLAPRVVLQHDVSGISPGPAGNFIEGRKAMTVGVSANYQYVYTADISYTMYTGAGRYNLINDRDFIAANIKYSF